MYIYLICYFLIITSYLLVNKRIITKKHYCIFISIILVLILGLRHQKMGLTDTEYVYLRHFKAINIYGLDYALLLKDKGFQLFTYIYVYLFKDNFSLYLFITAIPYIFGVSYVINKYSKYPVVSYIIFVSLPYYEISFALMRQVFAMGILLIAFTYLIEKKHLKFIFGVLIASCFHQVAIVFLIIYYLGKINNKIIYLGMIAVSFIISNFSPSIIRNLIYYIIQYNNRYSHMIKGEKTNLVYFYICLLFILVSLRYFRDIKKSEIDYFIFKICALGTAIAPLTIIAQEAGRISYLFGIFNILLFPNCIYYEQNRQSKIIIKVFACTIFILYFLCFLGPGTNVLPYRFFWQ